MPEPENPTLEELLLEAANIAEAAYGRDYDAQPAMQVLVRRTWLAAIATISANAQRSATAPAGGPMRLWLDCEFNGYRGELLSIALVDEYGRPFYEVLEEADAPIEQLEPWVAEHVIPVLGDQLRARREDVARRLEIFLEPYEAVRIVTDWPDDVRYFCELMLTGPGSRINTPPLTFEVLRDDAASAVPHNALEDARGLRKLCLDRERQRLRASEAPR